MGLFLDIFLLLIAGAFLVVSAVYAVRAAINVTQVSEWHDDHDLRRANDWLTRASILAWISVALVVLLIILYIVFASETVEFTGGIVSKGLLIIVLIVMGLTGSFAAVAASDIKKSPKFGDAQKTNAYKNSIISAVVAIVAVAIILFFIIFIFTRKHKSKGKDSTEELKEELISEKEAELELRKREISARERQLST